MVRLTRDQLTALDKIVKTFVNPEDFLKALEPEKKEDYSGQNDEDYPGQNDPKNKWFEELLYCVMFSGINDPENHQKEMKKYMLNKGYSAEKVQEFIDIQNDIGWA